MSWTARYTYTNKDDIPTLTTEYYSPDASDEAASQRQYALNVALEMIVSGVLGDKTKTYKITTTGHANENNEPKSGWANDHVSIQIYQEHV